MSSHIVTHCDMLIMVDGASLSQYMCYLLGADPWGQCQTPEQQWVVGNLLIWVKYVNKILNLNFLYVKHSSDQVLIFESLHFKYMCLRSLSQYVIM